MRGCSAKGPLKGLKPSRRRISVIAACKKHGKFAGMGGMYSPELLERHIAMGVQLVLAGSDFSLLMQAAAQRASLVRGFEKK